MTATPRRPRVRRSDCSGPGLRRLRRGRGFGYLDSDGRRLEDPQVLERIRELTIPPAWEEVWICSDPVGHLQATGVDAAGRKQYLYHPIWRERRDGEKFTKMVRFALALPALRVRVEGDLGAGGDPTRDRVLACAARLLDLGLFRIGSEQYADSGGGLGLATIRKEHVTLRGGAMVFDYPAKSGVQRVQRIEDPRCAEVIGMLKRRRSGASELLCYRLGRAWHDLRSEDINQYLKAHTGEDFSAKDFRTWNATVLAAVSLAVDGRQASTKTTRKRAINAAVRGVAEVLGNTPAVARRAYIDPRVFDRYRSGTTIWSALEPLGYVTATLALASARTGVERAVLELIESAGG